MTDLLPFRRALRAPVRASELLALARVVALGLAHGPHPTAELLARRYRRLELIGEHEIWLIDWPAGGELELHDHGGASGAFQVVTGTLEERFAADQHVRRPLRTRHHGPGDGQAFGPRYVHDLRNGGGAPARSVHVYSPPLTEMRFYAETGAGLVPTRTEREREWEQA